MVENKIRLIGSYPPPLGGVSLHIKRAKALLQRHGFYCLIFDPSKFVGKGKKIFKYLKLLFCKPQIVHFHSFSRWYIIVAVIARILIRYRLIFTDHNRRLFYSRTWIGTRFTALLLHQFDFIILTGDALPSFYKKYNVKMPRYRILPAFLSPDPDEEEKILKTYPAELNEFLNIRKPLLLVSVAIIAFYESIDLYGLDLCTELMRRLKITYPRIGLVFALAEIGDYEYFSRIQKMICDFNLEENVFFLTGQKEMWPLFKKADLFLRPTCTDSYGVSTAEALSFGVVSVASDVCKRPEKTILFKNRDGDDFYSKVMSLLQNSRESMLDATKRLQDYSTELMDIYYSMLPG